MPRKTLDDYTLVSAKEIETGMVLAFFQQRRLQLGVVHSFIRAADDSTQSQGFGVLPIVTTRKGHIPETGDFERVPIHHETDLADLDLDKSHDHYVELGVRYVVNTPQPFFTRQHGKVRYAGNINNLHLGKELENRIDQYIQAGRRLPTYSPMDRDLHKRLTGPQSRNYQLLQSEVGPKPSREAPRHDERQGTSKKRRKKQPHEIEHQRTIERIDRQKNLRQAAQAAGQIPSEREKARLTRTSAQRKTVQRSQQPKRPEAQSQSAPTEGRAASPAPSRPNLSADANTAFRQLLAYIDLEAIVTRKPAGRGRPTIATSPEDALDKIKKSNNRLDRLLRADPRNGLYIFAAVELGYMREMTACLLNKEAPDELVVHTLEQAGELARHEDFLMDYYPSISEKNIDTVIKDIQQGYARYKDDLIKALRTRVQDNTLKNSR
jgi:hypothetical protein